MKFSHHMHLHLEEIKMEKVVSKVMKGIFLCKPSICTLSCSWVVIKYVIFLFDKHSIMKKSFFGGGDEIPYILNDNDKL
jgi:hypothetical protein